MRSRDCAAVRSTETAMVGVVVGVVRIVVGPAMRPTMAAPGACCPIVTGGRGWWSAVWSGVPGELAA